MTIRKQLNFSQGALPLQLDLNLQKGDLLTLFGKSGAGKTSVLRILAGLLTPDEGKIIVDGTTWFDAQKGINLPPQKRSIGLMFQNYALFPNMTVKENLTFALSKNQDANIVKELIEKIELGTLQNRKPQTLSGGQQQRVALARALVQKPKLLLLDEPLSALDMDIRKDLQNYIQAIHEAYDLTTILVSHDEKEIKKISNQVVVLEQGQLVKMGTPAEIFPTPNTYTIEAEIIEVEQKNGQTNLVLRIDNERVILPVSKEGTDFSVGDRIEIDLRTRL